MIDTDPIYQFFVEVDEGLRLLVKKDEALILYHFGRSALILHYGLKVGAGTKDIDVIQVRSELTPLEAIAARIFGEGSSRAKSLGYYLDFVRESLPPMARGFRSRSIAVPRDWRVVRPQVLDVHDIVVSKLRCFRPQDRKDIQDVCDMTLLDADKLRQILEEAFTWTLAKDGDSYRDSAFDNLRLVIDYMEGRRITL